MTQSVTRPLLAHPGHAHKPSYYAEGPPLPLQCCPQQHYHGDWAGCLHLSHFISSHGWEEALISSLQTRKQARGAGRGGKWATRAPQAVGKWAARAAQSLRALWFLSGQAGTRAGGDHDWLVHQPRRQQTGGREASGRRASTTKAGGHTPPGAGILGGCRTALPRLGLFPRGGWRRAPRLPGRLCQQLPWAPPWSRARPMGVPSLEGAGVTIRPGTDPRRSQGFTRVNCPTHEVGTTMIYPILQMRKLWQRRNLPPRELSWQAQLKNLNLAAWPKDHCPLLPSKTHATKENSSGQAICT